MRAGIVPSAPLIKASIYFSLIGTGVGWSFYCVAFAMRRLGGPGGAVLAAQYGFVCVRFHVVALLAGLRGDGDAGARVPGRGGAGGRIDRETHSVVRGVWHADLLRDAHEVEYTVRIQRVGGTVRRSRYVPLVFAGDEGFLLPEAEVRMIDGTTKIIREHAGPGDTVFTYPSMPIFNAITGNWFPTYAGDFNIDACPDDVVRKDAATLLRARPAVVIYYAEGEASLVWKEILWRGGKRSGQRDMIAAVETLAKEYRLAATFDAPPTDLKVKVYVRP